MLIGYYIKDQIFKISLTGFLLAFFGLSCFGLYANAEVGAWIIFDAKTGNILDEKNSHRKWHPASLTKIMTVYIAYSAIHEGRFSKNSLVTISKRALQEPSSKLGLQVGNQITIETAIHMLLVRSANDVAVALAETIAGSNEEFIVQMNKVATRLGMSHTKFVNANGWPHQDQVTSARDMAILSKAIWDEFPEYRNYYANSGLRVNSQVYWSANKEFLTRVNGAKGIKTGYICDSGYNVVAASKSGEETLIVVVLGASSDLERTMFANKAMELGFKILENLPSNPKNLENLSTNNNSGDPPVKGYCNRNQPNFVGLYNTFGTMTQKIQSFEALAKFFSEANDQINTLNSKELPKLEGTNKTDWSKVFDLTVGEQLSEAQIIDLMFETPDDFELNLPRPKLKP